MTEYIARFQPEVWVDDQTISVDPKGESEWDCTSFVDADTLAYLENCAARRRERLDDQVFGVLDNDDVFKHDPAAPEWVREWDGPFTIRVFRLSDDA